MNVIYSIGFDVEKAGGKSRATRQKARALSSLCDDFKYLYPSEKLPLILSIIINELYTIFLILTQRPDVVVYRGYVGILHYLIKDIVKTKYFREVHAYSIEEVALLKKSNIKKFTIKCVSKLILKLELASDKLIFNHPNLKKFFINELGFTNQAVSCYNGFEKEVIDISESEPILSSLSDKYVFVFTGSASVWHGVDYILDLAKEFSVRKDVVFLFAGGKVESQLDNVINISPCDSKLCDYIISISDCCLLPVKNNRVSPGSPLKLYDYVKLGKPVVAPIDTLGYSDEVQRYGSYQLVDFSNSKETYTSLSHYVDRKLKFGTPNQDFINGCTWDSRVIQWFQNEK
ncbi:hypothetical protein [Vibrio splendidus]|uniref:hypothetical protein n=1 Tax=Vibrio splendidus TaxID=29497 RepID=UPI000D3762A3|nr:hypothetical protein [Vibrio splendidus]PTO86000.1 hypothetical protein CWO29_19595 [Vibrio splendidus]